MNEKNQAGTKNHNDGSELLWSESNKEDIDKVNSQFSSNNESNSSRSSMSKGKSLSRSISNFFRTIGVVTVLILVCISALFSYILLQPQSNVSKLIINNTLLNDFIDSDKAENDSGTIIREEAASNITNILGLDNDQGPFEFAEPEDAKTTIELVQLALPSVLSLSIKEEGSRLGDSNLVSGTGFIVSEDGLVVTNKHVIASECNDNSNSINISGSTNSQQAYELDLVSVDPIDDIAILKIRNPDNTTFSPVDFGDSNNTKVGSEVIAIGNVLGQLQNTVTKGIISGTNRSVETSRSNSIDDSCTQSRVTFIDNLIQTDAAINRGNSGGPLFDSSGLLIGMNTLGTSDSQNIGFALSSNLILANLNSYRETGIITRPRLGIYSRPLTPLQKQESAWLPVDYGEILLNPSELDSAVSTGSPADQIGLQAGDIILEVNGEKLEATDQNPSPLRRIILSKKPDEEITLTVRKATRGNSVSGFQYESDDQELSVKLGGISFELNNR
ncbi:MAG: trypsin-like peptidase domain-containing protein [Patescibacteria group bacterium]